MCQFQHRNTQNLPRHPADKIDHPPKNLPWTDKFCHFVRFEMAERQGLRAKGRNGNFWQGHIGVLFPSPLGSQPLALSLSIPSVVSCGPGFALRSPASERRRAVVSHLVLPEYRSYGFSHYSLLHDPQFWPGLDTSQPELR
jgi:hypothetical protein